MNDVADRITALRNRVNEVLELARTKFGVKLANVSVKFDVKGRVAGWASAKHLPMGIEFGLRFNREMILGKNFDDMMRDTVPHEIAHLVCYENPAYGRRHDRGWKNVCFRLGGDGTRCHKYEIVIKDGVDYLTDRGHRVTVSRNIHTKIQMRGMAYVFRKTAQGRISRTSPYCMSGGTMPEAPAQAPFPTKEVPVSMFTFVVAPQPRPQTPIQPAVQAATPGLMSTDFSAVQPGLTKAAQVRIWIREAKRGGKVAGQVAARAMVHLGMTRAQACRYTEENWLKA